MFGSEAKRVTVVFEGVEEVPEIVITVVNKIIKLKKDRHIQLEVHHFSGIQILPNLT